jgi:hypothetical protein
VIGVARLQPAHDRADADNPVARSGRFSRVFDPNPLVRPNWNRYFVAAPKASISPVSFARVAPTDFAGPVSTAGAGDRATLGTTNVLSNPCDVPSALATTRRQW